MNRGTLSIRLREATQAAHHRIDHHPALAPLVHRGLTLQHYAEVLRAMAWIYRTLDVAFTDALARHCPDDAYRCSERTQWLAVDLAYLHRDDPLPPPWTAPTIESAPALVGRLYAIEGSTLGGQVIARCVTAAIGVGPQSGGRMFHGHGAQTQARWAEFGAFAERSCPPAAHELACEAANSMFSELGELLDRWRWEPIPSSAGMETSERPIPVR